jgi:Protein of unknown function (DUF935)
MSNGILTRETARAGLSLSQVGGLPPIRGTVELSVKAPAPVADKESATPLTVTRAGVSGQGQTPYLGYTLDIQRLQQAFRAAEWGQCWYEFALIRDMGINFPHYQAELFKRKMAILGEPISILPAQVGDKDSELAAEVIREAIDAIENWQEGMSHLLECASLPICAAEKLFAPVTESPRKFKHLKRYFLRKIQPIDPNLLCFEAPYRPNAGVNGFNASDWQPWLRFYAVSEMGGVVRSLEKAYKPDPSQHIIMTSCGTPPTTPPNWGGVARSCLIMWLLSTVGRDWWAKAMQRYNRPVPVISVDGNNALLLNTVRQFLLEADDIGGLILPEKGTATWSPSMTGSTADAHEKWQMFCQGEVSKMLVGQVTSARPSKGGLNSGESKQAETVRGDIKAHDSVHVSGVLNRQVFRQILDLNGYFDLPVPRISFGSVPASEFKQQAGAYRELFGAGLRPTEDAVQVLSEKWGVQLERFNAAEENAKFMASKPGFDQKPTKTNEKE